jgi:acyl-coenzyme A synthetase/AMP-(fatty) acid ligase
MMLVPSLMRMMLDAHDDLAARLPLLRDWCIGGEPLTVELARRFARAMPGRLLLNLYGLSEAFDACYFDAGQLTDSDTLVPIGRPLANVQAYVLDAHRQPVPVGVIGELYVGGAGLARGYLGQPAMSAEKFIANPFRDAPGARIYRTGDLARLRPDGLIDYLGRSDHQVKIRGFRIEPDEIASVLRSHPDIAAAVVVARPDDSGELALAAYFVAREIAPAIAPLQGWLRERLPDYMVPASYTPLAALPMTPSGKVDRLSLPAPDKRSAVASTYVAPADETEQIIARLWQDVLQIERVGSQDNFFDLGGTSLRMVQINRRLCDALQRAIPVLQMYQHPTVSSLARSLAADSSSAPASSAAQTGRERAGQRRDMLARRQTTARRSPG